MNESVGDPSRPSSGERSRLDDRSTEVNWQAPETITACIVGAGAVGGLIGGRLAQAGADVTLVDQDDHLGALTETGLGLVDPDGRRTVIEDVTPTAAPVGRTRPDLVVLAVKTYDLPSVAPVVGRVAGDETVVLPVQNGIPWWYFQQFDGPFTGRRLHAVDPDGTLQEEIDAERILGCVPYVAASITEPGTVEHVEGEYFPVGELDGAETPRVRGVADLFEAIGLRSRVLEDVRSELWLKELGSLAFNPVSALTGATLEEICQAPRTRTLVRRMMAEAKPVAEDLGVTFRRSIDDRIDGAEAVGAHETSMLQDLRRGQQLETDALVGAVLELADLTDNEVPTIEAIYALTTLLETTAAEQ